MQPPTPPARRHNNRRVCCVDSTSLSRFVTKTHTQLLQQQVLRELEVVRLDKRIEGLNFLRGLLGACMRFHVCVFLLLLRSVLSFDR